MALTIAFYVYKYHINLQIEQKMVFQMYKEDVFILSLTAIVKHHQKETEEPHPY